MKRVEDNARDMQENDDQKPVRKKLMHVLKSFFLSVRHQIARGAKS